MSYVVAVRALCEFTAKAGDLDLRFTPAPSAQEGMLGHETVRGKRGRDYEAEISLAGDYSDGSAGGTLKVRGRADGYDPRINQLEEIKTYRGDLARQPANHRALHWAQAKVYGWLLCQARGLTTLSVALVYFDIGSQKETVLTQDCSAAELQEFFNQQCARFLGWARAELAHRSARDAALESLRFPHADFRPGQRALAEAVFKATASGRCLMAQAPTGIGKTVGTLFPLLKAAPAHKLDKVIYLAAKTPGRRLALDALARIGGGMAADSEPLRVLELVARDKACEHPDKACHGDSCPLAQGFYDRLAAARSAAVARGMLDKEALRAVALEHDVCPYYLSQDLAAWADVIVGDYNYYFDVTALLHGLQQLRDWRTAVLVDEAHNLLERARKMYSAELDQFAFKTLRKSAPAALKKPFDKLQRAWNALHAAQDAVVTPYQVYPDIPEAFRFALQNATTAVTDFFAENPTHVDAQLQAFYFDALHFQRMTESFDTHSLFDITKAPGRSAVLCIRNVLPAPFLAPRFKVAQAVILFSATLSPWHFYADTLGLPEDAGWIEVESPFKAAQLTVTIAPRISTRYPDRARSLSPIVDCMGRQYAARRGNYLAFFSSYDYLQQAAAAFMQRFPHIPAWQQARQMAEAEREAFLARFAAGGEGIGFAVLGGAFAEGIDLPGDRLIGAFIATLGLPQVNPVNEEMRVRMEAQFGAGYDYTYLYPGLQKVVQAAGRVIRTVEDRGAVVLMDDRYARAEVRALLPSWWEVGIDRARD